MKVSNVLFQTTCALALMVTSDMACAMMADGEGDKREERVAAARATATQLGIAVPADAVITSELAEGYETAGRVNRFYGVVQPVVPDAFPEAPTAQTWAELAQEASQGRYSPFFRQVIACVGSVPSYGGIRLEEFRERAAALAGGLSHTKQYDPREVGEYFQRFIDSLNESGQILLRKLALDKFVGALPAHFPIAFAEGAMKGAEGSHARIPLDSLGELEAFLAEKIRVSQGVVPVVELFGEVEEAKSVQGEVDVLTRRLETLHLLRDNDTVRQFADPLRDYVYALFLREQTGKGAEAVAAAKAQLVKTPAFQALEEAVGSQHAAEAEAVTTDERFEAAQKALAEAREEALNQARFLVDLKRAAHEKSDVLGRQYSASLDEVGRAYQNILWAKAVTLAAESSPQ